MIKSKTTKDGIETTVMDSGHIIKIPVQPTKIRKKPALVDATAMTAAEFRKAVLEKLGVKCK